MFLQSVLSINLLINSSGNFLYVLKGLSKTRPINSQCPVVVSFPLDFIFITPYCPFGVFVLDTPLIVLIFPKPSASRVGTLIPPFAFARLHKVLHFRESPYLGASSIAPIPIESITITIALFFMA